ncbi:MAG: N-(5'-phosphoribosyl)anthranilate isomerase [Gammaproteobacteria bacterium RIFCSPLOWO2_01_FULL_47_190]|nr:MAG: N-(5'-phosphoribosyl)anthranilate isomerase [Gammaproteobacteria bacterium RIFCSPLOWO2_01_FULL_47_190]OGT76210.1 MAG: N-(5'-phosphoribosyl)anthranilate isomerase [Gammaproteobacteria bacterium RIFCSPLOWO2_12_47_11]OGT83766.1 MAG: N-(5'-phosphoribosyl)anthranilate isomerase [Gammaproteobacteria bacterium RIFCSPLOWO2_12_FULL_47_76]
MKKLSESPEYARVRVKICGITRPQDALAAACLGVDAVGLVFYPASPRAVTIQAACAIVDVLPPFVCKVGLFVNAAPDEITRVLETVALDVLQFHGDEEPELCSYHSKPFIKAVRMQDNVNLNAAAIRYADASALLLDTYVEGLHGGTGHAFDWSRIPAHTGKPLILAGGLTPANVAVAIEQTKPYAVDVSGGVESAKGIKDAGKIAEFIREVRNAKIRSG